jgi:hypothetical protein
MAGDIQRFLERPMEGESIPGQPAVPPGSPIGDPGLEWLTPPPQGVLITGDTGLTCSFAGGGF